MRKSVAACRMFAICLFMAAYLVIVGIPVLTYCRLISNPKLALRLTRLLDRIILFLAGISVEIEGLEKIPKSGCVLVGNHRSIVDVTAVFLDLPVDIRFLGKKELFHIPLVSYALSTMGMIPVDRSNPEAAAKSIDLAVSVLKDGKSFVLFPEGTRSRSGELLPFKKGAFVLAIKAQVPVVPFTMFGAAEALRPDTPFLYPGKVRIVIHDPISTQGMDLEQRNLLLQKARGMIEQSLRDRAQPDMVS